MYTRFNVCCYVIVLTNGSKMIFLTIVVYTYT
jgi:hypothetical protein